MDDPNFEEGFELNEAEVPDVLPPFSSLTSPVTPIEARLEASGLRLAPIATPIRAWARWRKDVLRVVLGHTGKRYTLGVLVDQVAVRRIPEIFRELRFVESLIAPAPIDRTVLGPSHADALVFGGAGRYAVYDLTVDGRRLVA